MPSGTTIHKIERTLGKGRMDNAAGTVTKLSAKEVKSTGVLAQRTCSQDKESAMACTCSRFLFLNQLPGAGKFALSIVRITFSW